MNEKVLIDSLERFETQLSSVVGDLSDEQVRWRPPSGAWTILEIVSHLADEERFDFGERLKRTLIDPTEPWPSIEPVAWVTERAYNEGDFASVLARFRSARCASVGWLRGLADPDWSRTYHHPELGAIRAGDLLASWASHDLLHLKQIALRCFERLQSALGDYRSTYAGEWS